MNRDLIAYLLHEMTDEERLAFSEKWISDADLHEQLRMAEADLLDAYVRGDMAPEQRRRIEKYLLVSAPQQEKLAFANLLHDGFPPVSRPAPRTVKWFAIPAAACIVALAGATLWVNRDNGSLRRQVLETRAELQRQEAGSTLTVSLAAQPVRGSVRQLSIAVPSHAEIVRLELELDPRDQNPSTAIQVSTGGRVMWSQSPVQEQIRGAKLVATAWIPEAILAPGSYEIELASNGAALAYYYVDISPRAR